jgi:hypothetical protein
MGTPSAGLHAELDRIESAVDAGETDLRRLGFWRIVGLIKRDEDLVERYADQVGRIDAKAFRARIRVRLPVWAGTLILVVVLAVGVAAFVFAAVQGTPDERSANDPTLAGIGLLVAAAAWDVAVHSPTHLLVGRALGMRFTDYFLKSVTAPPGLKLEYASYLRASPTQRAWMHASGALASKVVPFLVLALAAAVGIDAPGWATAGLWILGVGQLITDLVFSTRTSDWKKVRREAAVSRARRATSA